MGNCPSSCLPNGSVHDAGEEECIKVVRVTDGQLFEYNGPVYVKDLMYGFEGFAVFHYSTIKQPLSPETELKFGDVYYLRPWISRGDSEKPLDGGELDSSEKLGCTDEKPCKGEEAKVLKKQKRSCRVRFQDDEPQSTPDVPHARFQDGEPQSTPDGPHVPQFSRPSSLRGSPDDPRMELLPQEQDGVLRLKLVISKKQLSDLMSTDEKANALVEKIIAPLLAEKTASRTENAGSLSGSNLGSWKPSLEHIPEGGRTR